MMAIRLVIFQSIFIFQEHNNSTDTVRKEILLFVFLMGDEPPLRHGYVEKHTRLFSSPWLAGRRQAQFQA